MPRWLQHAFDGTSCAAKAEQVEEAEAFLAGKITAADVEAALQEDADSAADAEGGEEEEPVHDPVVDGDGAAIAFEGWLCEYSWEAENGVRRREYELNPTAEYAKECVPRPHLGGDAPVLALWPDGYRCELENIVQSEKWPKDYPHAKAKRSAALPKNGESKQKKSDGENYLWRGELNDGCPVHT